MELTPFDKNFGLAGKTALVTGAGSGIGRAIADLFHEKGANVVLVDLDPADAAASLDAARSVAVAGDITQAAVRERAVSAVLERFGAVDILVNNAGLSRLAPAAELTEEQWDVTMNLNVRAAFFLAQRVGQEMLRRGRGGKIVNLASQAGVVALDTHVAYCASKAALISMTQVLALEWGPHNIQTNAISPTVVLTEMGRKYWVGERAAEMTKKIPNGRFAYPEEIAACALFLASDATAMINGQNILVDGGYTAQ